MRHLLSLHPNSPQVQQGLTLQVPVSKPYCSLSIHFLKMASFTAARSIFRSTSYARNAAARFASKPKASPASPFRASANKPLSQPIFRLPVDLYIHVRVFGYRFLLGLSF